MAEKLVVARVMQRDVPLPNMAARPAGSWNYNNSVPDSVLHKNGFKT